jgi:hypothetical protein
MAATACGCCVSPIAHATTTRSDSRTIPATWRSCSRGTPLSSTITSHDSARSSATKAS